MEQTTIIKLVQKELEELNLLLQGFNGMSEIPQPIKTLTISKAEHLLDVLRKLEYNGSAEHSVIPQSEKVVISEGILNIEEATEKENVGEIPTSTLPDMPEIIEELPSTEESSEHVHPGHENTHVEKELVQAPHEPSKDEITKEPVSPLHKPGNKRPMESRRILGESIKAGKKVSDVLATENRNSLGSRMEVSSIKDLKKGINLNDRFRFQKELFKNNADLMNKTLDRINVLSSFTEAEKFVRAEFGWDDSLDTKKDFMNLVFRRFQ